MNEEESRRFYPILPNLVGRRATRKYLPFGEGRHVSKRVRSGRGGEHRARLGVSFKSRAWGSTLKGAFNVSGVGSFRPGDRRNRADDNARRSGKTRRRIAQPRKARSA
jgi:hypothetical protein